MPAIIGEPRMKKEIRLKRVYEPKGDDGFRVLIDRLWPRGLTKEKVAADLWLKEIAPSASLRKWFGHEVSKWPDFKIKYLAELENNASAVKTLTEHLKDERVTLLYAAKDQEHNDAVVIKDYLLSKFAQ